MDSTCMSKHNGGHSNLSRLLLLLFLSGLQPGLSSAGEHPKLHGDRVQVSILGPEYVIVGVPSSVECDSTCSTCTFSMSLSGQTAQGQGNMLLFTINSWVEALTVTCTATVDNTTLTATATKQLQVLAGPANVSITGPDLINATMSYTYSCNAYCQPSCTYAWKTLNNPWIGGQGNMISITPQETDSPEDVVICKATNSVSGLFVAATQDITVISGPSEVQIKGPDVIEIAEKYEFVCTAECRPSCDYVSSVGSKSVRGNVMEMKVDHPLKSVTLKCEAHNTASRRTATALKTVIIKASDGNLSDRPKETSAVLLFAFITSAAFIM